MNTQVALLRGINLGPRHKVPMSELKGLAESLRLHNPTTYIQSGNLIFEVDNGDTDFAERLEAALASQFGFEVPVVARSATELVRIARSHPFASLGLEQRFLMVAFLGQAPDVDIHGAIDVADFEPDRYELQGRELYLAYPNGLGRSRLTHDLLQRRLEVRATIRNWRTVLRLAELVSPRIRS